MIVTLKIMFLCLEAHLNALSALDQRLRRTATLCLRMESNLNLKAIQFESGAHITGTRLPAGKASVLACSRVLTHTCVFSPAVLAFPLCS